MDKKKLFTMLLAALSVGFGGATLNFNMGQPSELELKQCLTIIDSMIKTHSGDLNKVADLIASN